MHLASPWVAALTLALAQAQNVETSRPAAAAYGWMWWLVIAAILVALVALSVRGWYVRRPR